MKRTLLLAIGLIAVVALSGCATTNDGRSGLRGELCFAGYCLTPQAMTSSAVTVNETAVLSGARVAPATIVSQPVVETRRETTVVQAPAQIVPQYAPAPPAYIPPPARSYPLEK